MVTLTECLYAQLADAASGRGLGAVPGAQHAADRPVHLVAEPPGRLGQGASPADPVPEPRGHRGPDGGGRHHAHYTEPAEVADQVVEGVRREPSGSWRRASATDEQIRARADSMVARANPTYLRDIPG